MDKQRHFVKGQPVAELYIEILKAKFYLQHGEHEKGFEVFSDAEKELKLYRSFPKLIFSSINEVKAIYYWNKKDFQNYSKSTLNYLAYANVLKFSPEEKLEISRKLVLSLLLCNSSLNFGDVVQNPFF